MGRIDWNLMAPEEIAQTILDIVDIKISEALAPAPAPAADALVEAVEALLRDWESRDVVNIEIALLLTHIPALKAALAAKE